MRVSRDGGGSENIGGPPGFPPTSGRGRGARRDPTTGRGQGRFILPGGRGSRRVSRESGADRGSRQEPRPPIHGRLLTMKRPWGRGQSPPAAGAGSERRNAKRSRTS